MSSKLESSLVEFETASIGYSLGHPVIYADALWIERGARVGVVGRSGCGKTTLLRAIAGDSVVVEGVSDAPIRRKDSLKLSLVPQRNALIPWKSALSHVRWALDVDRQVAAGNAHLLAEQVLSLVGLGAASSKYPDELSGGMSRRLMLAIAIAANPEILLLDEPLSALDPVTKAELISVIQLYMDDRKCAMFLVSHDYTEIVTLVERILIIGADGCVEETGFQSMAIGKPYGSEIASSEALRLYQMIGEKNQVRAA
jgi:ABC-type nitrate/sulfonate/bicarbonate transport system ATPase subunit